MRSNSYLDISWSLKKSFVKIKIDLQTLFRLYVKLPKPIYSQETGEVRDEHFKQFI